jgi:hypothetical protein
MTGRKARATAPGVLLSVVLALATIFAAGCSSKAATLDRAATERAVGRAVGAQVTPAVRSTACPGDIRQKDGEVSRCTVTLAGTAGRVRVLVRQVDGKGRLTVILQDAVLANAKVAAGLQADLAKTFGRPFTATCGNGARVVAPGAVFRCRADDGNGARQVKVTVKDPAGTVSFDVSS